MPAYTRRQLKEDKFAKGTQEAVHWATEHRRLLIVSIAVVLVLAIGVAAFILWSNRQADKANLALSRALQTYVAPIRPANTPPDPATKSFASMAERSKQAEKEFKAAADEYPYTKAGKIARYMAGTAAVEAGDNAQAEQLLKTEAADSDRNIAALAKLALANFYRDTNRSADAARLYKELADNPTETVSKGEAQLQLAEMYETVDPKEAQNIYQQIQKEDSQSPAAMIASSKLANLTK